MERAWNIVSILCLMAAAFFVWRRNFDPAFALAALGAVAWFLSYRVKLRATIADTEETTEDEDEAFEDEDVDQK